MIGARLQVVRKAQGLSIEQLAKQIDKSANTIRKYEQDKLMPSSDVLLRLLNTLNILLDFLFRPVQAELDKVEFRKKSTMSQKLLNQIKLDVSNQVERWLILKKLWPDLPIQPFVLKQSLPTVHSLDDIDTIADTLRQYWELGTDPISNMIHLLEELGIVVIVSNVDNSEQKFDGLQTTINGLAIIVVSSVWTGDRQRFTLAHELVHLILENISLDKNIDIEKACNRFASAFLLPKSKMLQIFGKKRHSFMVNELSDLKQEYGISMAAILYRAKDLKIIEENDYINLQKQFRLKGWHKKESDEPYASEETHLFKQLVYRAMAEEIISESKGTELLGIPVFELLNQKLVLPCDNC